MRLKEIKIRSDDNDRRPPPEPERPGLFDTLRERFDDATLSLRKRVNSRIRTVMDDIDHGRAPSLSDVHRAAAVNQLIQLRSRINAGGVDGLVASGHALIECSRLKPV
jgi:hypothetical protein